MRNVRPIFVWKLVQFPLYLRWGEREEEVARWIINNEDRRLVVGPRWINRMCAPDDAIRDLSMRSTAVDITESPALLPGSLLSIHSLYSIEASRSHIRFCLNRTALAYQHTLTQNHPNRKNHKVLGGMSACS